MKKLALLESSHRTRNRHQSKFLILVAARTCGITIALLLRCCTINRIGLYVFSRSLFSVTLLVTVNLFIEFFGFLDCYKWNYFFRIFHFRTFRARHRSWSHLTEMVTWSTYWWKPSCEIIIIKFLYSKSGSQAKCQELCTRNYKKIN